MRYQRVQWPVQGGKTLGEAPSTKRNMGFCCTGTKDTEQNRHAPQCNGRAKYFARGTEACVVIPVGAGYKGRVELSDNIAVRVAYPSAYVKEARCEITVEVSGCVGVVTVCSHCLDATTDGEGEGTTGLSGEGNLEGARAVPPIPYVPSSKRMCIHFSIQCCSEDELANLMDELTRHHHNHVQHAHLT